MDYIKSEEFSDIIIYLILLSCIINFILQINKLLGQNEVELPESGKISNAS
ncbi:MAG: hypothetical protein R3A12_11870 [Ignavibacteria bacterium]